MFDEKLANALNFTDEDLNANRAGRMSVVQSARLYHHLKTELKWSILGIPFFVGLLILLGFSLSTGRGAVDFCAGLMFLFAVLSGMVLISLTVSLRRSYLADLNEGRSKVIQGSVNIQRTGDDSRVFIPIDEGCLSFNISREAGSMFHEGQTYRFYFAPRSHFLLSAEPVKVKQSA